MGELIDKGKGTAKEIAGRATGDRALIAEGKRDRVKGEVKGGFERVKQAIKNALHRPAKGGA